MSRTRDFADLINGISAAKITSGTFADARLSSSSVTQHVDLSSIDSDYIQLRQATADLSNLNASNLTSGTIPSARVSLSASDIPSLPTSKITSGTFADARLASTNVTQHVDLSNLNASNLTSGTVPNARYGTPTFNGSNITSIPAMSSSPTTGSWTPTFSSGSWDNKIGRYQKFGQLVFCQCEMRMTGDPSNNNNIFTFGGLPFTSVNITGGYSNTWFVGQGGIKYHSQDNATLKVKNNSTNWYIAVSGNNAYRMTQYYATYDKSGTHNSKLAGERWRYDNNSDRRWGFASFYYISAS